jgi:hypothetical protein
VLLRLKWLGVLPAVALLLCGHGGSWLLWAGILVALWLRAPTWRTRAVWALFEKGRRVALYIER